MIFFVKLNFLATSVGYVGKTIDVLICYNYLDKTLKFRK